MPVTGPKEFFGENENEHLLGRKLFQGARANILRGLGFTQDATGNRKSLCISFEITDQLVGQDTNPFVKALRDSGWGTVPHRGGDTSVGGFQEGKNDFQAALVDDWIERSQLVHGRPGPPPRPWRLAGPVRPGSLGSSRQTPCG